MSLFFLFLLQLREACQHSKLLMMANIPFSFQVGVFLDVPLCNGMNQIGRIHSITQNTLSVCWWAIDNTQGSSESFYSWLLLVSRILFTFQPYALSSLFLMLLIYWSTRFTL